MLKWPPRDMTSGHFRNHRHLEYSVNSLQEVLFWPTWFIKSFCCSCHKFQVRSIPNLHFLNDQVNEHFFNLQLWSSDGKYLQTSGFGYILLDSI